jgi:hypothetical protein
VGVLSFLHFTSHVPSFSSDSPAPGQFLGKPVLVPAILVFIMLWSHLQATRIPSGAGGDLSPSGAGGRLSEGTFLHFSMQQDFLHHF